MKKTMMMMFMCAGGMFSLSADAVDALTFSGSLVIPTCVINNNKLIATVWGNVDIQTLDPKDTPVSEKTVKIPVNCPYYWGKPKMKLTGTKSASGQKGAIATSKDAEGLEILIGQSSKGDWINVGYEEDVLSSALTGSKTAAQELTLYASLARFKDITDLKTGAFNASAGLELRYE